MDPQDELRDRTTIRAGDVSATDATVSGAPIADASPTAIANDALPPEVEAALRDPERRVAHYALLAELGRGGMGVVYRAFDATLKRAVAIKMISDPARAGADALRRFRHEATAAAKLRHPGIVSVHEAGEHEGKPFIAMELVQGESLAAMLDRAPIPPRRAAELVRQVALALAHAHAHGVVHRDVKPENVIVAAGDFEGEALEGGTRSPPSSEGRLRAKLMDFGLAYDVAGAERLTASGAVLGTPAYMAPEQASGDTRDHGPRTDVYALGAVLYRAIAGRPPHAAPTIAALLERVIRVEPDPPRRVNPAVHQDLETIALRALAKEPERRYASAADVAEELRRFLDGEPIVARPIGRLERARLWARRNRRFAASLVALACVVVALVALATDRARKEAAHERELETARVAAAKRDDDRRRSADIVAAGTTKFQLRDYAGALADFDRALALDPTSVRAWCNRGAVHARLGQVDAALADFDRALALDAGFADAWAGRAHARGVAEDWDGEIADATRAIELYPGAPWAWNYRGSARRAKGDLAGAIADFTKDIELDKLPEPVVDSFIQRSATRGLAGDLAGAIADASEAIRRDPRIPLAWSARAFARSNKGDPDGAIADLERTVELAPGDRRMWTVLGKLREAKGDLDGAIAACSRAIELDTKFADAWYTRGMARAKKSDQRSVDDLKRFCELAPSDPRTKEILSAVRKAAKPAQSDDD